MLVGLLRFVPTVLLLRGNVTVWIYFLFFIYLYATNRVRVWAGGRRAGNGVSFFYLLVVPVDLPPAQTRTPTGIKAYTAGN
jgi:hypothetical protein